MVAPNVRDADGNGISAAYVVDLEALIDILPPVLTVPSTITVDATRPSGARVSYTVSATDNVDPNPDVSCSPLSGGIFPIGTTTVTCVATDAAGNTASKKFTIVVKGAADQLADLLTLIRSFGLPQGITRSFTVKVEAARAALRAGEVSDACDSLRALINEARAQAGKKLTTAQASRLSSDAARIRAVLAC